jgi:hypothetical protein
LRGRAFFVFEISNKAILEGPKLERDFFKK